MSFTRSTWTLINFSNRISHVNLMRPACRNYRKGLRRKPISVIENEPQEPVNEKKMTGYDGAAYFEHTSRRREFSAEPPEMYFTETLDDHEDNYSNEAVEGIPSYEKLGEKNGQFTSTLALLKSRKQREKKGLILLEGKRLIADGILAGVKLTKLFFSREENITGLPLNGLQDVRIMKVFYKDIQLWSDLTTSPGVMGVFKMPDYSKLNLPKTNLLPITIVCNNVRDPGNMGSIIRCAAAAGCRKLLLTKGCIDPWEPKVLRSASGGHFRIEVVNNISSSYLSDHLPENAKFYVADNSPEISGKSTQGRHIPVPRMNIYTDVDYINSETVLVIGGETEGLSKEILAMCEQNSGMRLHIPMLGDVESLNSAMATAIIVFEMKRQYREAGQLVSSAKYLA